MESCGFIMKGELNPQLKHGLFMYTLNDGISFIHLQHM